MNYYASLFAATAMTAASALASSHMDAPKITKDPAANTTDVYAFLTADSSGRQYLTAALAVYPFEEPGIGPNNFSFDDNVRYSIHVALDKSIAAGEEDLRFDFEFSTSYLNSGTIRQAFLGPIEPATAGVFPANLNLRQSYRVVRSDGAGSGKVVGEGIVPPNNQGLLTRFYNQNDDGDQPAKGGAASPAGLDPYTRSAIAELEGGGYVFAGQRDDGFYGDIQSIFDLDFSFGAATGTPTKPFDSQGGYNVHTIVISIPLDQLTVAGRPSAAAPPRRPTRVPFRQRDGDQGDDVWSATLLASRAATPTPAKIAGVYATTARSRFSDGRGPFEQVARQGNPLFVEALLPLSQKDQYNEGSPRGDASFGAAVDNPELLQLLGGKELIPGLLRSIFIPDMIKVDLTTGPARLAGAEGFNRLGVFGGDVLKSTAQDPFGNGGFIPGGWPNGRRFGDDVVDIAIIALGLAGPGPDFSAVNVDRVSTNDITYNRVFPYAATPLNGRVHPHHVSLAP